MISRIYGLVAVLLTALSAPIWASSVDFANASWRPFGGVSAGCDGNVDGMKLLPDGRAIVFGEFRACGSTVLNNIGIWDGSAWQPLGPAGAVGTNGRVELVELTANQGIFIAGQFTKAGNTERTKWFARFASGQFLSLGADPDTDWPRIISGSGAPQLDRVAWIANKLWAFGSFGVYRYADSQWRYADAFGSNGTDSGPQNVVFTNAEIMIVHDGGGLKRGVDDGWYTPDYPCVFQDLQSDGAAFYAYTGSPLRRVRLFRNNMGVDVCENVSEPAPLPGVDLSRLIRSVDDQNGTWVFGQPGVCGIVGARVCRREGNAGWVEMPFVATNEEFASLKAILQISPTRWLMTTSALEMGAIGIDQIFQFSIPGTIAALSVDDNTQGVLGRINAMALSPDSKTLYVGGLFRRAGKVLVNNVAQWDGQRWRSVGNGAQNGVNGEVFALQATATGLLVGGQFEQAGTQTAASIARFDSTAGTWSAIGAGFDSPVRSISTGVGALTPCVGLDLSNFGDAPPISALQCWDGINTWRSPAVGVISGKVLAIANYGELYAAGDLRLNGADVGNLVKRVVPADINQPAFFGPVINGGSAAGANGTIRSLFASNSFLMGGDFTSVAGANIGRFASFGSSSFTWISPFFGPTLNDAVDTISASSQDICIAGRFTALGASPAKHVLCRDQPNWRSLGSGAQNGTDTPISAIVVVPAYPSSPLAGRVFVGGDFDFAGGELSLGIGEFGAPPALFKDGFEAAP